jgi:hypothetical protein
MVESLKSTEGVLSSFFSVTVGLMLVVEEVYLG